VVVSGVLTIVLVPTEAASAGTGNLLFWLLLAGMLIALFLGPLAAQMEATRARHFSVWTAVVLFNLGSVAIEGAYFAPALVTIPIPSLLAQQLLGAAAIGALITLLFSLPGTSAPLRTVLQVRPWYSWAWRFLLGSCSYLVFYFVFGALNYSLVTQPYYASHAGGLAAPPAQVVLAVEAVRAPLIILSVALFVLSFHASRRRLTLVTGLMLFWVGGLVPLVLQASVLPPLLLIASGVEIFFQNFSPVLSPRPCSIHPGPIRRLRLSSRRPIGPPTARSPPPRPGILDRPGQPDGWLLCHTSPALARQPKMPVFFGRSSRGRSAQEAGCDSSGR
jgi:hypothetical protein